MSIHVRVLESFEDLVMLLDHEGRFTDCLNGRDYVLFLPREAFLGRNYRDVLPRDLVEKTDIALARLSTGVSERERFDYTLALSGRTSCFSCTLTRLEPQGMDEQVRYVAIIRDTTEKMRQLESIAHKEQALVASAVANEALLKNRNIVQAASVGLRELGRAMRVDRCYMFRNSWNETIGENVCNQLLEWTNDFIEPHINNPELQDVPFSLVHPFMDALLENRPYVCVVSRLPACGLYDILSMQGIKSLVALPIWVDGALWGFVGFDDCATERQWSNADVSILGSFATSIATAVTRRRIEDDLEKARIEAEKASDAKSIFLSNITHELRTPLHGVVGYAEMLSHYEFAHPELEYFHNLKLSSNLLYELINNILDISKIEAGVFEMNPENYILADIIRSSVASVSYLTNISGNQLVVNVDYQLLPEVINIDAPRLKQILVNLLSNALKFSSDSTVELDVALQAGCLRFSIRDHGIGITQEQLSRMFTPFTQFDSSLSKKYPGTGLGLPITRHILEQMGSRPEVQSVIGEGSTFAFALPLDLIGARQQSQEPSSRLDIDLRDVEMQILLVEDNRLNMLLAETVLRDVAPMISIHKAENGMEAIQSIESGVQPDLVLMDLQMPLMDGFETTAIIRDLYHKDLHIVALTASAISDVRDRCMAAGMNEFLTKPFTRDQIAHLLQRHAAGRLRGATAVSN